MLISKRLVRMYQNEYKRKFNADISEKDAERELFDLATLVKFITKERRHNHGR